MNTSSTKCKLAIMKIFRNKTAVVTGAASGMGRAMALRFGQAGMNVVVADVNDDAMAAVVAELDALTG